MALRTASFAIPRELGLIYGAAWGTCWPCFSFRSAIFCLSLVMVIFMAPSLPVVIRVSLKPAVLASLLPP